MPPAFGTLIEMPASMSLRCMVLTALVFVSFQPLLFTPRAAAQSSTSIEDPTPEAREPFGGEVAERVVEQAGVGGPVPFGAAGVLEVGGAGYISGDEHELWIGQRPFVGIFIVDGLELSLVHEMTARYGSPTNDLSWTLLWTLECNGYIPIAQRFWFELGVGGGLLYNAVDAGVVGTARAGIALLVGRSGMLKIAATGGLANVPFASPEQTLTNGSHFRVGGEVTYSALF